MHKYSTLDNYFLNFIYYVKLKQIFILKKNIYFYE
jgi:hypothetical protein